MFFRFDNNSARVEGALLMAGLPPRDVHHVMKRQGSFVDGWGRCKSCDCRGYVKSGDGKTCVCGHHYTQHY